MNVAVLSCHKNSSIEWLVRLLGAGPKPDKPHVMKTQSIVMMGADKYFVVTDPLELRGLMIDTYMKAPDYFTLEDEAKSRLQHSRF